MFENYDELRAIAQAWKGLSAKYPLSTWSVWGEIVANGSIALVVRMMTYADKQGRSVLLLAPPRVSMTAHNAFWHTRAGYVALLEFMNAVSERVIAHLSSGGLVRWVWQFPNVPSAFHSLALKESNYFPMEPSVRNGVGPMKHVDTGLPLQYFETAREWRRGAPDVVLAASCAKKVWDTAVRISSRSFVLSLEDIDKMREEKLFETAWLYDPEKRKLRTVPNQVFGAGTDSAFVGVQLPIPRGSVFIHTHPELCSMRGMRGMPEQGESFTYNLVPSATDNAIFLVDYMMNPKEALPVTLVVAPEGIYAVTVHPNAQKAVGAAFPGGISFPDVVAAINSLSAAITSLVVGKDAYTTERAGGRVPGSFELEDETVEATLDDIRRHLGPVLDDIGSERIRCGRETMVTAQLERLPGVSGMMYISTYFDGNDVADALSVTRADASLLSCMRAVGDSKVLCIELHRYSAARNTGKIDIRYSLPLPHERARK